MFDLNTIRPFISKSTLSIITEHYSSFAQSAANIIYKYTGISENDFPTNLWLMIPFAMLLEYSAIMRLDNINAELLNKAKALYDNAFDIIDKNKNKIHNKTGKYNDLYTSEF